MVAKWSGWRRRGFERFIQVRAPFLALAQIRPQRLGQSLSAVIFIFGHGPH